MGTSYNPKIVTDGLVLNLDPANVKSYPAKEDPYVNNVSLMLDGESLVDQSANARTFTASVGASVSTANKKFGNSSIYCTGSTSYIYNSSFNSSFSGDFTIEFWAYHNSFGSSNALIVIGNESSGRHVMFINGSGKVAVDLYFTGTIGTFNTTISTGTWNHYVLTRSGTTVKLFVNGTLDSTTVSVSGTFGNGNGVYIGAVSSAVNGSNAYFDDIRITSGISRYTASFTPPVAPLSLPGRITDLTQGKNNQTLTGSPAYSSSNGGIMTFNGTTAYTIGARPTSLVNGGQITIALWAKWTTVGTTIPAIQALVDNNHNSLPRGFIIQDRPDLGKVLTFSVIPNGNGVASTIIVGDGTWHHIVCTNNGTNSIMYIDGKYNNSGAEAGGISSVQPDITIGKWQGGTRYLNGSVANVLFYNRALTAAEVFQNYNATKGRFV